MTMGAHYHAMQDAFYTFASALISTMSTICSSSVGFQNHMPGSRKHPATPIRNQTAKRTHKSAPFAEGYNATPTLNASMLTSYIIPKSTTSSEAIYFLRCITLPAVLAVAMVPKP